MVIMKKIFFNYIIALSELKNFVSMSGEKIYPKYKHFFEKHLELYPNKLEFTNKIYID